MRKYYNHKLWTNPWHHEEEPHNNYETPRRQTKQSNQLFLKAKNKQICIDKVWSTSAGKYHWISRFIVIFSKIYHKILYFSLKYSNQNTYLNNVSKKAMIRNQYNHVPHLTQDTTRKSDTNARKHHIQESQEVIHFPAGDHNSAMNRQENMTNTKHK